MLSIHDDDERVQSNNMWQYVPLSGMPCIVADAELSLVDRPLTLFKLPSATCLIAACRMLSNGTS